ncbi:MAG: MFS transporter [Pseudomonadota bacterium]
MSATPGDLQARRDARPLPFFVIPFIVSIAFLMEALDTNIITATIPMMAQAFGVAPVRLNLAITSYVVCLAIFIPISGWLSERVGAKRLFLAAMGVFVLGSLACGLADSFAVLIAARVLQGIGGALMTPSGRLILLRSFDRSELVSAISYMTLPVLIGPLLGPVLGGLIATYTSWRWIFLINIPIGLVGLYVAHRWIPDVPREPGKPFDLTGFLLVAAALVALQIGLENQIHPALPELVGWALWAASAALLVLFGWHARGRAQAVMDVALLALRSYRAGVVFGGINRVSLNAVPFLLQLKLQVGLGYTPLHAGLLVFIMAFGALSQKMMTGRILRALGFKRTLAANALIGGLLTFGLAEFGADSPLIVVCAYIFAVGVVRSLQFNAINVLIYSEVPKERQSGGVALAACAQQVSMGLGISLSAVLLSTHAPGLMPDVAAFDTAFRVMGAIAFIALGGFLFMKPEDGMEASGHHPKNHRPPGDLK